MRKKLTLRRRPLSASKTKLLHAICTVNVVNFHKIIHEQVGRPSKMSNWRNWLARHGKKNLKGPDAISHRKYRISIRLAWCDKYTFLHLINFHKIVVCSLNFLEWNLTLIIKILPLRIRMANFYSFFTLLRFTPKGNNLTPCFRVNLQKYEISFQKRRVKSAILLIKECKFFTLFQ